MRENSREETWPCIWFGDVTEPEKSEIEILSDCYASTSMSLATALGFFSKMCSIESLKILKSQQHLVTALSVETWPGVLQMIQKHIKEWKVGLEAEIEIPVSEAYSLSMNAKSLVGSVRANFCGSHYPIHMAMVEGSSQKVMIDNTFSLPKCVQLATMSHHSKQLLKNMWGAVPGPRIEELSDTWGEELLSLEKGF